MTCVEGLRLDSETRSQPCLSGLSVKLKDSDGRAAARVSGFGKKSAAVPSRSVKEDLKDSGA